MAVLWMVAALSLSATGLIAATRVELRGVTLQRDILLASAVGDAAIMLAAGELKGRRGAIASYEERLVDFNGRMVTVRITPVTGLIDVGRAPDTLLRDLFAISGGLDNAAAERLATAVALRAKRRPDGDDGATFHVPEDLMRVEGFSYSLYAKISRLIVVGENGGRVNPHAASPAVLRVLAGGDEQRAQAFIDERQARGALADTTRFPAAHASGEASSRVRIEALVPLEEGMLVRSRFIDLGSVSPGGAPWWTYRIDAYVSPVVAAETLN